MARKKKEPEQIVKKVNTDGIVGLVGSTTEQAISETLEINYMPYAMSVIVSRAIPEIDGFKPSHRKLLYTMYKMGLLGSKRVKSANIVGQTMQLNPHGDAAIYETMVRLAKGNETLLHPFVDSKGNFGKVYSRDMAYAAARYTEAKLDSICTDSIFPVLNMLNMKYMILAGKDNAKTPVLNPGANGNAWMVDKIEYVADADAEIKALHGMDTKHSAVADKKFENVLGKAVPGSKGHIKLTQYAANELAYEVDSEKGGIAVFSEIYYPEWTCLVDGKETEIGRVNYVLRAIRLEPGKHSVVFRFDPKSIHTTEAIAYAALGILALILLLLCVLPFYKRTKQEP